MRFQNDTSTTITPNRPTVPPPQPPPVPPTTNQPLHGAQDDALLVTLARGIEALLQQQGGSRSDNPGTVTPAVAELPSLPEYQPSTGSIDLLHWLIHIAPLMEDLSDTSLLWWQETVKGCLDLVRPICSSLTVSETTTTTLTEQCVAS